VWLLVIGSDSFFTTDDHVFFAQARELPLDGHFLTEPIYDHFSPWHRLLDHVVSATTDQGWWLALIISLLWFAIALFAFAALVRRLVGAHPAGLAAVVLFALSPVFVQSVQWWALSAQLFPQVIFTVATLVAALEWQATRRPLYLVLVWVGYALALCAFIKALLALPLLVLVLYARPGEREPVKRDRWMWAGLVVLTIAYVVVISGDRYYRFIGDLPGPTVSEWAKFFVAGWGEGVAPLVIDGTVPNELGPGNWLVLLVGNLAVAALIAASVRAQRRVAFTWLVALAVVAGGLVMSGRARIGEKGIEFVALEIRYHTEAVLALLLAGAMAARAAWPAVSLRGLRVAAAAAALVAVVLAIDAGLRLKDTWVGPVHRAYFDRFAATFDPEIDIVDAVAPNTIVAFSIVPWNLLSEVLPEREPGARIGTGHGPAATVDQDGTVHRIDLQPVTTAPGGCAPLTVDVDATGAEDELVLGLRRTGDLPAADATVVADSGVPGGATVRGFKLPQLQSTPLRLARGQAVKRLIVAVGPVATIAINPGGAAPLCVSEVGVERFPLP
jgi:hypothetical protein